MPKRILQQLTEFNFGEKNVVAVFGPKRIKNRFFWFFEKMCHFNLLEKKVNVILGFHSQISYLRKFLFFSYDQICSTPKSQEIANLLSLIFCM